MDYSYYQGRIDRLFLHKDGKFQLKFGVPSDDPTRSKPESIENYVSQYSFIDGYNYCVYINTEQTEQIKILAYAKLIATLFQRMRKNAGLHPWDPINLGIYGETEYEFDKIMATIEKTCSIKPTKLDESITQFKYEFKMSEYTEDPTNNLIMYLF